MAVLGDRGDRTQVGEGRTLIFVFVFLFLVAVNSSDIGKMKIVRFQ